MNFKIESVNLRPTNYDYEAINFKNKNIYLVINVKIIKIICLIFISQPHNLDLS